MFQVPNQYPWVRSHSHLPVMFWISNPTLPIGEISYTNHCTPGRFAWLSVKGSQTKMLAYQKKLVKVGTWMSSKDRFGFQPIRWEPKSNQVSYRVGRREEDRLQFALLELQGGERRRERSSATYSLSNKLDVKVLYAMPDFGLALNRAAQNPSNCHPCTVQTCSGSGSEGIFRNPHFRPGRRNLLFRFLDSWVLTTTDGLAVRHT